MSEPKFFYYDDYRRWYTDWPDYVRRVGQKAAREECKRRGLDPFLMNVHEKPAPDPVWRSVKARIKATLESQRRGGPVKPL